MRWHFLTYCIVNFWKSSLTSLRLFHLATHPLPYASHSCCSSNFLSTQPLSIGSPKPPSEHVMISSWGFYLFLSPPSQLSALILQSSRCAIAFFKRKSLRKSRRNWPAPILKYLTATSAYNFKTKSYIKIF